MKHITVLLMVFALSIGLGTGMVYGHGGDPTKIHSCVNNASGEIKIVDPNDTCKNNWTPLDWGSAEATRTEPRTTLVNCPTDSLQDAIDDAKPRDTLLVSGVCKENVHIGAGKRNLTLNCQGTATINRPDPTAHTVQVDAVDVTIRGFTITGGRQGINLIGRATIRNNIIKYTGHRGITVEAGGVASIMSNVVHHTGEGGVYVILSSYARIIDNTIRDNPEIGILVSESSSARIGFSSFEDTVPQPNTIQNNGQDEISVIRSSSAVILSNTINGMASTGAGIRVSLGSHADIGDNDIKNNQDGIVVSDNSNVNLGATVIVFDGPNTGSNSRNGIRCRVGGTANGTLGTLTGGTAPTNFGASCTDSLDVADTF